MLADMIREVVQEMRLHQLEIHFFDNLMGNFWLGLHFIMIKLTMRFIWRRIVQSGVTLPFLLYVQSRLHFQGFRDLLWRFTGTESTESILLTSKLLQRREIFSLPKVLKESPRKFEQSHSWVLRSCYHSIVLPGSMACWIERGQDMVVSSSIAGWICQSCNVVQGRMLHSPSNT